MATRQSCLFGITAIAAVTAVVHTLGQFSTSVGGLALVPAIGIAFAVGLRWSELGAVAVGIGILASGIFTGGVGSVHFGYTAATIAFALVSIRIWRPVQAVVESRTWDSIINLPEYAIVAGLAALPAAAVAGSILSLLSGVPFFLTAPDVWSNVVVNGILFGMPLSIGIRVVGNRLDSDIDLGTLIRDGTPGTKRLLLLSLGWIAVGSAIDLGFTLSRIVPVRYYSSRFGLDISVSLFNTMQFASHAFLLGMVSIIAWRFDAIPVGKTSSDDALSDAGARGVAASSGSDAPTNADRLDTDETLRLTRRQAVAALASMGIVELGTDFAASPATDTPLTNAEREQLLAVADVIYPSAVSVDQEFLETYVTGRYRDRFDDRQGAREALAFIDEVAKNQYGSGFSSLSLGDREAVLHSIGVDRVGSVSDGRLPERVRYYVVNDLLFALFSTPVGGELIGWENPTGYPGGLEAYQGGVDA